MKRNEFKNLKIGDTCICKRGHDEGVLVKVLYIEEESILIKTLDGGRFKSIGVVRNVRLTGWHELDIVKIEDKV